MLPSRKDSVPFRKLVNLSCPQNRCTVRKQRYHQQGDAPKANWNPTKLLLAMGKHHELSGAAGTN